MDLAGSERISKTDASGDRLVEAAAINKSLTSLGQVFQARDDTPPTPNRSLRLHATTLVALPPTPSLVSPFLHANALPFGGGNLLIALKHSCSRQLVPADRRCVWQLAREV